MFSRRETLGMSAVGLLTIAGCTSSGDTSSNNAGGSDGSVNGNSGDVADTQTERPDSDDDGVIDAQDAYPSDPDLTQKDTTSDTRKLEEDEWRHMQLEFPSTGYLSYDFIVREGPEIDVIFMEDGEYSHFEDGNRFEYIPDLSSLASAGNEVSAKVPSGTYRLIFDNSNQGEASPPTNFSNDVITVEYELEMGL